MLAEWLDAVGLPGVVWIHVASHVDLWTAKEQEDNNSDNEATRRENNELDGTDWSQFEAWHDETSTETTQSTRQWPGQR